MLHMDIIENKKKLLQGTDSILLVDGWRNKSANRKYLVFTVRNINTPQTFLTFYDTSIETEDGENLALNINEAIRTAKEVYDTNIYAIITDNDRKIVNAGKLATTVDDQELLSSTCSSHSGNLLIKSFINDEVLTKIREIVNTFREPKFESLLIRSGGTKLKNFPDTRFCYYRDTCQSIIKNLPILRQLSLIEDLFLSANIVENVLDADFESALTESINYLDPICKLINKCQDSICNVADATELWLSLELPTDRYREIINQRIKKAIWSIGYASNLLNHKYNITKNNFSDAAKREFEVFLETRDNFNIYSENCQDPIAFWKLVGWKLPNLSKVVIRLMIMPASTALIESFFFSLDLHP